MAWFHSFFDREYVEILKAKRPGAITRREVDALWRSLKLRPGMSVMDIPSGFGRHAVEFARRGCRVTAIDLSRSMLSVAKPHPRVSYRRMDMRRLPYRQAFHAIFSSSSGYFSERENRAQLSRFARALKPGGRLALWTFSTEERARTPKGRSWSRWGERYVFEEHGYDADRNLYRARWAIWRLGRKKPSIRVVQVRGYSERTWRSMLECVGLRLIKIGPKPVSDDGDRGLQLIVVKPQHPGTGAGTAPSSAGCREAHP